jgi:hypothetical protein
MEDSTTTRFHSIRCPFCEVYELEQPPGSNSAHCTSCRGSLWTQRFSVRSLRSGLFPTLLAHTLARSAATLRCAACPTDIGGW